MPPARGAVQLAFPGVPGAVLLADAPEVRRGLARVIKGWTPRPGVAGRVRPISVVEREGRHYRLWSPAFAEALDGLPLASAVCGVAADLAQGFLDARPARLALHCGAVAIAGRLVAFTGPSHAGKSTLIARLSAEPDIQVFCDDALPLMEDETGFGLGIAPRLRLPLPAAASPVFRTHVAAHLALGDDRYGYVPTPNLVPHGTRATLAALIVLDRRADGSARLGGVSVAEAVHHLLAQNMGASDGSPATFARVAALAERLHCLRLTYAELEGAVALLRRALGAAELPQPPEVEAPGPGMPAEAPVAPGSAWRRSPEVALRRVRGETLLWHCAAARGFHLNPVAAAVWRLLDSPRSAADIAGMLAHAFPEEAPGRIHGDVGVLLGRFAASDLVVPAVMD